MAHLTFAIRMLVLPRTACDLMGHGLLSPLQVLSPCQTILSIQSVSSEPSMPDTVTANQNSALPTGNLPDLATFKARMAPNGRSNTLEI